MIPRGGIAIIDKQGGARPEELRLWTVAECADILRLSRKAIYGLVWAGSLPYVRIGRRVRVPHQALTAFIQDRLVAGPQCRGAELRAERGHKSWRPRGLMEEGDS